jgi:hypothetical protein
MALSSAKWLERYRARIVHHRPDISRELLDDYATIEAYEVMSVDFPDDPELAVDIDPDLAYVDHLPVKQPVSPIRKKRWPESSPHED